MAPRGRPPKPLERLKATQRDATHKANGTAIARTEFKLEPAHNIPVCPDFLGPRGESEWEKIWSAGFWLSRDQDYHWVAMIATAYDEIEQYRQEIMLEGLTVRNDFKGVMIAHPLIAEIRKAQSQIMKALSILGFSPTDRARLALGEVKLKSDIQALQDKQRAK